MSIRRINGYLPKAIDAIKICGICDKKTLEIDKTFRGQISSFGAAVQMGSLQAAVAFFTKQGGSDTERQKLMDAIKMLVYPEENKKTLLELVICDHGGRKNEILDAAVAIKLAMNAYILVDAEAKKKRNQETAASAEEGSGGAGN